MAKISELKTISTPIAHLRRLQLGFELETSTKLAKI